MTTTTSAAPHDAPRRDALSLLTRRTVVFALSGASVALSQRLGDGVGRATPDEVLALRPLWQEALAAFDAALAAKTPIERRYFARRPPHPDRKSVNSDDAYRAAMKRFAAICADIAIQEGLPETERLEGFAIETYHALIDRIMALPARTMSGLAFKAEVYKVFAQAEDDLADSIIDDLLMFCGNARPQTAIMESQFGTAGTWSGSADECAGDPKPRVRRP